MSGLTLDDELLALAASGDESGEEGELAQLPPSRSPSRSRSRSISRLPSRSSSHSFSRPRSRSLSRSHPRSRSRSKHRSSSPRSSLQTTSRLPRTMTEKRRANDAEEDGEASPVPCSPTPPASLDSPGSPGSLGSGAMEESDDEGSDDEGGTGRGNRGGETTFEREKRLAEQAEKEQERLKHAKLKALINERDRDRTDTARPKRKADSVELEEDDHDERPSRRTKQEPASRRIARRKSSPSPEPDSPVAVKPDKVDGRQPGTIQEYERVRMGRSRFAQVCFFPGFEDRFSNSFARVCSSQDPMTGQNVYRMCQIKGFKSAKAYKLAGNDDRVYMTDRYIVASYGPIEKEYPFTACSDSKFTEDEFRRRNQMLESSKLSQTSSMHLIAKCQDIHDFLGQSWTSTQITQKVNNQFRLAHLLQDGLNPVVGPKTLQRDEALYKRNQENRRRNAQQVHDALLAERKKRRMAAEEMARKQRQQQELLEKQKQAEVDGLFDDADGSQAESVVVQETKAQPIARYVQRDYKNGVKDLTRTRTDDEIIAAMDIEIDVEI